MNNTLEQPAADPVQLAEDAALAERDDVVHETGHARLLTDDEWAKAMPPFYVIQLNFDQWSTLEYEIALKFLLKNGTGWIYYRDKRFVIEKEEDYCLFRMWAENKPMTENDKALEVK
jgi:hypothetical protein